MLRLAITGCAGRMGKALVQAAQNTEEVKITAATVSEKSPFINLDVGHIAGILPIKVLPVHDLRQVMDNFDILIDFTSPAASIHHLKLCHEKSKKMVIGTTGFNDEQKNVIQEMSQQLAIVFSPNMSVGMNLCYELIKRASQVLSHADIEIVEAHHRNKVDAPSGTALKMGEIICGSLSRDLEEVATFGRRGIAPARSQKTIGFSSIRGGDIVGDHTVIFAEEGERVEISHRASNRSSFAQGALRAAKWLAHKSQGLYTMADVIFE